MIRGRSRRGNSGKGGLEGFGGRDPDSYAKRCGAVGSRVGGERSSLGGVKNHERSEYILSLERQEFVVRNGATRNGG